MGDFLDQMDAAAQALAELSEGGRILESGATSAIRLAPPAPTATPKTGEDVRQWTHSAQRSVPSQRTRVVVVAA